MIDDLTSCLQLILRTLRLSPVKVVVTTRPRRRVGGRTRSLAIGRRSVNSTRSELGGPFCLPGCWKFRRKCVARWPTASQRAAAAQANMRPIGRRTQVERRGAIIISLGARININRDSLFPKRSVQLQRRRARSRASADRCASGAGVHWLLSSAARGGGDGQIRRWLIKLAYHERRISRAQTPAG